MALCQLVQLLQALDFVTQRTRVDVEGRRQVLTGVHSIEMVRIHSQTTRLQSGRGKLSSEATQIHRIESTQLTNRGGGRAVVAARQNALEHGINGRWVGRTLGSMMTVHVVTDAADLIASLLGQVVGRTKGCWIQGKRHAVIDT